MFMKAFPEDIRLSGPLTPMRLEVDIEDCVVRNGEIPTALNGGFYRSGPTFKRHTRQGCLGFMAMDGMVQGLILENGKATYRNRWVRTPKYLAEEKFGQPIFDWEDGWTDWRGGGTGPVIRNNMSEGVAQGNASINAFPFARREVLAVCEQGLPPVALDPITLETKGVVPWWRDLSRGLAEPVAEYGTTFTAHPKWDHVTGEVFGWAYRDTAPYLTMHFVKPDGTVKSRVIDDAPFNSLLHDIWLTKDYVVVPFQPFYASNDRVRRGLTQNGWDESLPVILGIVPRSLEGEVRWIKADFGPEYIMHTASANTDGNIITLDGPIYHKAPFPFEQDMLPDGEFPPFGCGVTGRWIVDLEKGTIKSERLDDFPVEFPKVDERFYGRPYENAFMLGGANLWTLDTVIHRNVRSGKEQRHTIKRDAPISLFEPTFAPRSPDSPEGDGYLLVPISRYTENKSEYVIYDTQSIESGPIAEIELPVQIGWTPHGHYMDFNEPAL
jgi:carotenoid cleavage dioxygenase